MPDETVEPLAPTPLSAVERMLLDSVRREADRLVHEAVNAILTGRQLDPQGWGVNLRANVIQPLTGVA